MTTEWFSQTVKSDFLYGIGWASYLNFRVPKASSAAKLLSALFLKLCTLIILGKRVKFPGKNDFLILWVKDLVFVQSVPTDSALRNVLTSSSKPMHVPFPPSRTLHFCFHLAKFCWGWVWRPFDTFLRYSPYELPQEQQPFVIIAWTSTGYRAENTSVLLAIRSAWHIGGP